MGQATRNVASLKNIDNFKQLVIIILSAGDNPKMRSCGPRSTLVFQDETLLERQVRLLKKQFVDIPIIVVHGYKSNYTINRSPRGTINVINPNWEETGVAKSLAVGMQTTKHTDLLMIYGDLVFNTSTIRIQFTNKSSIYIDRGTMRTSEVGCVVNNGIIENIMYDLPDKWAQIAYFTGNELNILNRLVNNPLNDKLTGLELINEIITKGGKFIATKPRNIKVYDIDTPSDIKNIEDI
jgi:choline kinase